MGLWISSFFVEKETPEKNLQEAVEKLKPKEDIFLMEEIDSSEEDNLSERINDMDGYFMAISEIY